MYATLAITPGIGMNLILQIDESVVSVRDKSFKHPPYRHDAISHGDLAFFVLKVGEVLHGYVKQPRASFVNRFNNVRAVCPASMQQPMRGSMSLTAFNTSNGECHGVSSGP